MTVTVRKWGSSLGVIIPKNILDSLHIIPGSKLDITVVEQKIIIKNHRSELEVLLEGINNSNVHEEIFHEGDKRGAEIW